MSGKDNLQGNGLEGAENATMACLVIALAVYLVRIMPWALSEYWYDEVLTYTQHYGENRQPKRILCK